MWPGEWCHLGPMVPEPVLPESDQGLSCPAVQQNMKCFPIWQGGDRSSEANHEQRDELDQSLFDGQIRCNTPYSLRTKNAMALGWGDQNLPVRQFLEDPLPEAPHTTFCKKCLRPVHAFDEEMLTLKPAEGHVERFETQIVQCESPPAGLFKSVEFMKQGEYDAFSRRMRRQDGQASESPWRGIL
ncbi:MAG: hypothetical protein Q9211_003887 [Gyalolechia sp. 1 TL-2023]